jgi:hypothetical protein
VPYPDAPTTRSGIPGSLWWITTDGGKKRVWATQWDALLARFQHVAARLVPPVYAFPADGDCSDLTGTLTGNIRRRDAIDVDGVFGNESRDLLGYLLCSAGETLRAKRLADETRRQVVSDNTVAELIMFATLVSAVGKPGEPSLSIDPQAATLQIQPNTVLPTWLQRVASAPEDREWLGAWLPESGEPQPIPPSLRVPGAAPAPGDVPPVSHGGAIVPAATTPPATTAAGPSGLVLAGLAGCVLLGAWVLMSDGKPKRAATSGRTVR